MSYPPYSKAERIADAAIHVLGVSAAMVGIAILFISTHDRMEWSVLTATAVYSAALLVMLSASAAYHILADTAARPLLRRLDHAAIYLKIAGTFTPLAVFLGTAFGYFLLLLVWGLALLGARTKLRMERGKMTTGWMPYLALGWLGVMLFVPLATSLPGLSLYLILLGGLLYTVGIIFYSWEKLRYANAIWHGFVLVASGCFFVGIGHAVASPM
ncbi:PAQR family membrane homeostasis protein TrhA [Roseovarius sp. ZX-A-9]|uniref:PAQR family membrane homeostasis protein TrhA n=1 Tax=Roseovarius sp. ZX-A-9 TaxID=3014783 RepID=UPI00232B9402|nr:hemolysin III family protein [Roseovarius sp. ZX-A-9]